MLQASSVEVSKLTRQADVVISPSLRQHNNLQEQMISSVDTEAYTIVSEGWAPSRTLVHYERYILGIN